MRLGTLHKIGTFALMLAVLFSVVRFVNVHGQDEIILASVQIDIWPEYDQPSVLVIYHISLAPTTSLPADLRMRIPAEVGRPYAVAMQDPAGLYNLNYEINAAGEWIEISFQTPVPDFRIEYYDPRLDLSTSNRSFLFRWPGDYPVENLSLSIQKPPTATNMTFKPHLGSGRTGDDGLIYFNDMAGAFDAGTTYDLAVSYTKPDDQLTSASQFQPVRPQGPINANTDGRIALDQVLPLALGGLSLLLILAGGIWYWRTGRTPRAVQNRAAHHRSRIRRRADFQTEGGESVFCQQCGKKANQGDIYCRACGTKLK